LVVPAPAITHIADYAFAHHAHLKEIRIPGTIRAGGSIFAFMRALERVQLGHTGTGAAAPSSFIAKVGQPDATAFIPAGGATPNNLQLATALLNNPFANIPNCDVFVQSGTLTAWQNMFSLWWHDGWTGDWIPDTSLVHFTHRFRGQLYTTIGSIPSTAIISNSCAVRDYFKE
jgi:hypothetical protein